MRTLDEQLKALGKLKGMLTPAQHLFLESVRRSRAMGLIRKDKLI